MSNLDIIVSRLNDKGYRVWSHMLNSKSFGYPQNRDRAYVVGVKDAHT